MRTQRIFFLFLAVLGFLLSCEARDRTVRIVSDVEGIMPLLELFMAQHPEILIKLDFETDPAALIRTRSLKADIVVARSLMAHGVMERFLQLDKSLASGSLASSRFLQGLGDLGVLDGTRRLVPLAFDLPIFYGNSSFLPAAGDYLETYVPDLDTVRDLALQGNKTEKQALTRLGFSPLYDEHFLLALAISFGANFRSGPDGEPLWDDEALLASLQYAKRWVERSAGSVGVEQEFLARYAYLPVPYLLSVKRFGLAHTSISNYLSTAPTERSDFSFVWHGQAQSVTVLPNIISAALVETARNIPDASLVLEALLDEDLQRQVIEASVLRAERSFGYLGMLSTNRIVYEQVLPRAYPELSGVLPPEQILRFSSTVPASYTIWESEVLLPFLKAALEAGTGLDVLKRRTEQWLLQRGVRAQS